jgi:hypothetical protein
MRKKNVFSASTTYNVLPGLLTAGVLVPLAARLAFFASGVGQRLNYPFFQSGSEGLILSEVAIIQAGGSIYVPFRADQFISAPYPPLYYYIVAWLGNDPALPFTTGRLVSLVAALATTLFIAVAVFFSATNRELQATSKINPENLSGSAIPEKNRQSSIVNRLIISLVAGLTFLSLPAVNIWAVRLRADMLMTALQIGGLALVAAGVYFRRDWLIFGAVIPFSLAFFAKQTALAGPAATGAFLFFYYALSGYGHWFAPSRWRKTAFWVIAMGCAVGVPFLLINLATGNELYRRLFKYHNLPWLWTNFETYLTLFWQETAALLVLSFGLVLLAGSYGLRAMSQAFLKPKAQNLNPFFHPLSFLLPPSSLAVWYLLASLVLLLGLGVSGADHNHFLPAQAALCFAAGVCVIRLSELPGVWRGLTLIAVVGLGLQAAIFSVPPARYEIEFRVRDADYQRQMGRIIEYARSKNAPILSNEAGFYVLTGRGGQTENYYNDLFTLAALDEQKLYSQDGLLERIRTRQFGVVLAQVDILDGKGRPDVWTPELVAALRENYYRKFADVWYIFEPKTGDGG